MPLLPLNYMLLQLPTQRTRLHIWDTLRAPLHLESLKRRTKFLVRIYYKLYIDSYITGNSNHSHASFEITTPFYSCCQVCRKENSNRRRRI
jgi:hypothetical protein